MDVYKGKTPAIDDDKQIDNIAYKMRVSAKAADYTVVAKDSGTVFMQTVGDVNFTLPDRESGLIFWFIGTTDHEIMLTSDTAGKMMGFNDVAIDTIAFTTAGEQEGCGFMAFSDGAFWYPCIIKGLATTTLTQA